MNKIDKKKLYIIISIIVGIIALISVGTYAWYVWNTSDDDKTKIVTRVGAATVYYDGGAAIENAMLRPVSDKSKGIVKTIQIKTSVAGAQTFDLFLDITSIDPNLQHESFRYEFYKGSETTPKVEGNFTTDHLNSNTSDCSVNTGVRHVQLLSGEKVNTSITTYTLYIWIDGENYTNPDTMQNKSFSFKLHASGQDAVIREGQIPDITENIEGTLAYNLVSMYNSAEKSDVTNNGIIYHYDTENRLMSDIAGNVRFYGSDDTTVSDDLKNYIYFNCDDYSSQSADTCEVWRIIGVFDGKVKIMRGSVLGNYSWDNKSSGIGSSTSSYGSNEWSDSRLMMLLNPGYDEDVTDSSGNLLNEHGRSYYWNSGSGSCYSGSNNATTTCDFTSTGLKNDTTRGLISESLWYLRGHSSSSVFSDRIYEYERTTGNVVNTSRSTTWTGKVAIPYPSDYGYAADFGSCNVNLNNYSNTLCTGVNWMKSIFTSSYNWLLTPHSGNVSNAWYVDSSGYVRNAINVYYGHGVVPVLYLNSELSTGSGDGSQDTPYQLKVSVSCPDCKTSADISVGDYISYTPGVSSFTTDTSKTNYSSTQTITPSELNLWRVLSINNDGTVDIISENVSSTKLYFKGQLGYQNFVGYLNDLAEQYETSGITVGSRHFGYSNQTEYITDTSKFTSTAPWTCSTGGTCNPVESQGGGDNGYLADYNLVNTVLGTRAATNPSGTATSYWMASRRYYYDSSTRWDWYARSVFGDGSEGGDPVYCYGCGFSDTYGNAIRPIVTLSSEVLYDGEGTSGVPYEVIG